MRSVGLVAGAAAGLWGASAWADYSPPAAKCTPPPECTTCEAADCRSAALDAGLIMSDCADFTGASSTPRTTINYFCPPGVTVSRVHSCGCASAEAAMATLLAAVPFLRRHRRRGKGGCSCGGP